MAPFNWFNRQHSDQEPPADSTEGSPEVTPEEAQAETQTEAEPAIAQDQLNWAKLAYENIRKRQEQEAAAAQPEVQVLADTPEVTEEPEVAEEPEAAEVTEATATPEITEEPEVTETALPDAIAPEAATSAPEESLESEAEPIAAAEIPLESDSPSEIAELIAEPVAEPIVAETAAPLPFWAQAEAERLERLERLKEEAIANETPIVAPTAAIETAPLPEFALDEGFIWSAEILAAQGRRPEDISLEEITWLKRLRQGLDKTRRSLVNQLKAIVGQGPLNQDAVMEIESLLLQADVGVEATDYIVDSLQAKLRQEVLPPSEAIAYLKQLLRDMLEKPLQQAESPLFVPEKDKLNIWLVTGVNGAGKTTTIGKIAHIAQKSGYRCLIAAADTFRAAAVQQVQVWGDRSNVEVIANPGKNTDPAAVVFDAIAAAQSRNTELLIIDTAGRLQNKKNLMDELSKIRRIIDKKAPHANVESLLVLDSTLGQNGLRQAEVFSEAAKLSGVVLTKLDGTAKGGIAIAVVQQLGLPIRFIGAGEGIEDLRPFSSYEFIEALLSG